MQDKFLVIRECINRLLQEWIKYDKIVVAVDYDYTINDFRNEGLQFPDVIDLLKEVQNSAHIVCFTASDESRYDEIRNKFKELGIRLDGINESPVKLNESPKAKIYYNILLDDRAGLYSAYITLLHTLEEYKFYLLNNKQTREEK